MLEFSAATPPILSLIQVVLSLGLLFWLGYEYMKTRYQTIRYLVFACCLILLTQLTGILLTKSYQPGAIQSNSVPSLMWALLFSSELIAIFCLLLFFEAFTSERVFTKRNIFILVFITIVSTSMITSGVILDQLFYTYDITLDNLAPVINNPVETYGFFGVTASIIYFSSTGLGILLTIVMSCILFINFLRTAKIPENSEMRNTSRKMSFMVLVLVLVPIILSASTQTHVGSQIGLLIISLSIGLFFLFYLRGGMFRIKSQSLKRLLVIDAGGVPIYSYNFEELNLNNDKSSNIENGKDQDILFSGALRAISILLEEFTGTNHSLEEIFFGNLFLIIKQVQDFSIVLVTEHSSIFFKEALNSFSSNLFNQLSNSSMCLNLSQNQEKVATQLLEDKFGVGGRVDLGLFSKISAHRNPQL